MSAPRVVAVAPGSPAARVGLVEGDEILSVNGEVPRDLLEWRQLVDDAVLAVEVRRGGLETLVDVDKRAGEPLGVEVHSALFDKVRTCDNHCEFCFIYQLPPGLRRSLYLKDDDYRLSFLYGNFTTLTRFTEADLERVVTEGLSPLYVSIHATDPEVRAEMLRNPRGASRFNSEGRMRPHTRAEAEAVVDAVHDWQDVFLAVLGHRLAFAADEYYLLAERPFPDADISGSVDADYEPYRAVRASGDQLLRIGPSRRAPVAVLTAPYGDWVLRPLVERLARADVRIVTVDNDYFGGNVAVSGLMVGSDLARVLDREPAGHRYLLPDVCLTQGRFLDGSEPRDLPRPVEIVPTDGASLSAALGEG